MFLCVGLAASMLHLFVVFYLVSVKQMLPLFANVIAFLIAFQLSYLGHRHLSFANRADERVLQLPHFFSVAVSAGLLNEFLYFLFLRFTPLNYFASLIIVIALVSVYTYSLSKLWACR